MSNVRCIKHRGKPCDCFTPVAYEPERGALLPRPQALEVYYACRAFSQNIAYAPKAVERLAHLYLSLGDALAAGGPDEDLAARLKEAGFGGTKSP